MSLRFIEILTQQHVIVDRIAAEPFVLEVEIRATWFFRANDRERRIQRIEVRDLNILVVLVHAIASCEEILARAILRFPPSLVVTRTMPPMVSSLM